MAKRRARQKRLIWVDALRGLAIVLMIIFHFCYDLRYFGYVAWDVPNGPNWWPFRYVIVTLFLFTVGVSLSLAHRQGFNRNAFVKRLLQLVVAAIGVTIISLLLFPNSWIYFGILHFIAVSSLLGIRLVPYPKISLCLAAFLLFGFWPGLLKSAWPFEWFGFLLPAHTEDFVPLIPWLAVVFSGIGLAGLLPINKFDLSNRALFKPLVAMGRHGLIIYLIHQPLLFAGFLSVGFLGDIYLG